MSTIEQPQGASGLAEEKRRLRRRQRTLRASLPEATVAAISQAVAERVVQRCRAAPPSVIAAYWPLPHELDPRPCFGPLRAAGHEIALPALQGPGQPLLFRRWDPGVALVPAAFGTQETPASQPLCRPAVVLVPLLAFDRQGQRLGYGGGYYDRTLEALRASGPTLAVGLAFACLEQPAVPTSDIDQPLDEIITEAERIVAPPAVSPTVPPLGFSGL